MNANILEKEFYQYVKNDKNYFTLIQKQFYDGVWCWNLQDTSQHWTSERFWSVLGINSEFIDGNALEKLREIVYKEDFEKAKITFLKHLNDPSYPCDCILRIKHYKHSFRCIHFCGKVLYNEEGEVHRFIGFYKDITALNFQGGQTDIKDKVQETDEDFKRIQQIAHLGSWSLNIATGTVLCSVEFCKIFGCDIEKPIQGFLEHKLMYTPESAMLLSQTINKTVLDGLPFEIELNIIRTNGSKGWICLKAEAYRDNRGKVEKILGVVTDITKYKSKIKELIDIKSKAEDANRQKSAFLANMSHEIRTPLNSIIGFASFLKDRTYSKEEKEQYVDIIINSGNHLSNLVNDIIDISKIDAGQVKFIEGKVDLNMLIRELYNFFHSSLVSLGKNDVLLKMSIPEFSVQIKTDETRLRQILINLIGNAVKFTKKGEIEFGYSIEKGELQFFVKDTGIGIHKEKREVIFERFQQENKDVERLYGGTGLGLAIVKACLQLLNGKIWIQSALGKGTTFYFTIQAKMIKEYRNQGNLKPSLHFDFKGKLILIAEDDNFNFEYLRTLLSDCNVNIIRSDNGYDVITKVKENDSIELVLMDIQMPGLSGDFATQEIRKVNTKIPIIAQTATALYQEKEMLLKIGCNEYISKPVRKEILLNTIKQYLKN